MFNAIQFIFDYVYHRNFDKASALQKLTVENIKALQQYQPRTQVELFPEDYEDYHGKELELAKTFSLFRGMYFKTKEDYELFLKQIKGNMLITDSLTSWTLYYDVAKTFAEGAGYFTYNPLNPLERKGYKGLILTADYIPKKQILFSVEEATFDLSEEFEEEIEKRDYASRYHEKEGENVLLPGYYKIKIEKEFSFVEVD